MKIDIFNLDEFIKANKCLPVTNPVALLADGSPTQDGLFSEIIFGQTLEEKMNRFAYIDLKGHHFVHPAIYSIISGRMKKIDGIIRGITYAKLDNNKKLVIVPETDEDGNTGIDWLYENFNIINWIDEADEIDSIDRHTRLSLFKSLDRDEFFVSKWLVLPRGYRDYNINDNSLGDDINSAYKKLIQLTRSLDKLFGFEVADNTTKYLVQKQLELLYDMTLKPITGKNVDINKTESKADGSFSHVMTGNAKFSMFRKNLIGTHVDFGISSVITSPNISTVDKWNDAPAPFGTACIPLQSVVSMLFPFFIHECSTMLENIINYMEQYIPGLTLNQTLYSPSKVQLLLKRFVKSAGDIHDPILFEGKLVSNPTEVFDITFDITEIDNDTGKTVVRPFTQLDLVYICAVTICKNKRVLITRYPVTNNQNITIFNINVNSTTKTKTAEIILGTKEHMLYSFGPMKYPTIKTDDVKSSTSTELVRVLMCGNAALASFSGDYDGDMLYCRCLFSNEANVEADKIINSKANYFDANGKLTRSLTGINKEPLLGLFELTKRQ